MNRKLSKLLYIGFATILLASCSDDKNKFSIEGEIKDASGKTLYLENVGTSSVILLDSVKLKNNGVFTFKYKRPDVPDFYRLRLGNQIINIAIDSTETIKIYSDTTGFAKNYMVEGSAECEKIKELTLLQLTANKEYNRLKKQYANKNISITEYQEAVNKITETYKTEACKYIYSNPLSTSAYFALFQQIDQMLLFNPYDKTDSRAFGAVANGWHQHYSGSLRAVQLYNLYIKALAFFRGERSSIQITESDSKTLFDINLTSWSGENQKLSDIGNGKITLIDFTAYSLRISPEHNILLADIYNKYKSTGFEIYQISLDSDEHFWKNASSNLPWICVRDPETLYSRTIQRYNVSEIPTSFIRNKNGEIVARIESYQNLEKEIAKFLK
ncbi:MAG: AhpC/TSA family protein [Dysgonamonadaceae bacterium]|jgi:hypothetical protein|nr:AhpC/TSA family protein [Dysgonamonadaceae bacterium]